MDILDLSAEIEEAQRHITKAVSVITDNEWLDPAQYEEAWINKAIKPALFALNAAKNALDVVRGVLADDIKEAEQELRDDKIRDDYS